MKSLRSLLLLPLAGFLLLIGSGTSVAALAEAWHIPSVTQTGIPSTMRDPFVEIAPAGTFTVYTGFYKNNEVGGNQKRRDSLLSQGDFGRVVEHFVRIPRECP